MQPVDTFTHAGIPCAIYQMEDAGNPYDEYDCASRLVWLNETVAREWMRDVETVDGSRGADVAGRLLTLFEGEAIALPFAWADYGSGGQRASIQTEPDDRTTGFVCVSRETVAREWNDHPEHGTATERAENCARAELAVFAQWLEGDVYGYVVADGTPEEDSCWGFYGHDGMHDKPGADDAWTEARSAAEYAASQRAKREWWPRVYLLDPTPGPMPA